MWAYLNISVGKLKVQNYTEIIKYESSFYLSEAKNFLIIETTYDFVFLCQNQLRISREHFFSHFLNYNVECTKSDIKESIFNCRDFVTVE